MILDFHEIINSITHLSWAILSIPAGYFLIQSRKDIATKITCFVFALTALLCYSSSFLYHSSIPIYVPLFRTCDHIAIFLLIAGTYTPIIWHYCSGLARYNVLTTTWGLALLCIWLCATYKHAHDFMFLIAGWGTLIIYMDMTISFLHRDMLLVLLGGLCYTTGALIEFSNWPIAWHHEIFHVFVMAGTTIHYGFIWKYINGRPTKYYEFSSLRRGD